ncbi:MAG: hypothetical protein HKN26_11610 [Acidimicrobiales bacterium]|nr:hypothetical protein [Acidimicrobiales bacterium]
MTLLCVASVKGSPGVTLTTLALAAAWPTEHDDQKVLIEADADGGTLAVHYQLGRDPGLIGLTAAAGHQLDIADVWNHSQELPGGLPVVVAPDQPDKAANIISTAGCTLARPLAQRNDLVALVDCGRLSSRSAANDIVRHADALIVVLRPTAPNIQIAAHRLAAQRRLCENVTWLLVGDRPYSPAEIQGVHQVPVLGVIADDLIGARGLEHGTSDKKLRRSAFIRSIANVADTLADRFPLAPPGSAAVVVGDEGPAVDDRPPPPSAAPPSAFTGASADDGTTDTPVEGGP